MPITPQKLKARVVSFTLDYEGEQVGITYRPATLNADAGERLDKWMERANAAENDEDGRKALRELGVWICELVTRWEYLEDDGETMVPLTPERVASELERFPEFVMAVVVGAMEDKARGNANGTTSPEHSGATS